MAKIFILNKNLYININGGCKCRCEMALPEVARRKDFVPLPEIDVMNRAQCMYECCVEQRAFSYIFFKRDSESSVENSEIEISVYFCKSELDNMLKKPKLFSGCCTVSK